MSAEADPGRSRSLRRRLVWSFIAVAAVVALVTGITTLSLLGRVTEQNAERRLSAQVQAIVDDAGDGIRPALQVCAARNTLAVGGTTLYIVSGGQLAEPPCRRRPAPAAGAPKAGPKVRLGAGLTSGTTDGLAWAAAPLQGGQFDAIVLARPVDGPGAGLVGLIGGRLLAGAALGIALAAGAAWLLSGRLIGPLSRLAGAAHQLGTGRLDTRVRVEGDDEVAEVATAFNDMAASLEQHDADQRAFLASIGHELRTPLTVVQGNAEALLDGAVEGEAARRRALERLHGETLRLARLVADLLALGRVGRGSFSVDVADGDAADVLHAAAEVATGRGAGRDVPVEARVPGPLPARFDADRLRQVLDNLLDNAVRSNPPGRSVLLAARALDDARIEVVVADQGPGIAEADLPHAFERGYLWSRYRGTRTVGSGLGLSIVRALCDAMGASVWAEPGPTGGLAVHLVLPAATGPVAPAPAPETDLDPDAEAAPTA
jgi:two-component system sensor histidine kinase BaeS